MTSDNASIEPTGGGAGVGGVDGAPKAAVSKSPWHPPVAIWQLFLLILLTLGIYIPFWSLRVAQDMKRHKDQAVTPWLYLVGWFVGIAAPFVAYRQSRQIRLLNATVGQSVGLDPLLVAVWVALAQVAGLLLNRVESLEWDHVTTLLLYACAAFVSVPILLMQRQFNLYKSSLDDSPSWTGRPFRFTKLQYLALAAGAIVMALAAFASSDSLVRSRGAELAAGAVLEGSSGLYALTVPDDGWVRIPSGTIEEGTDLELYGRSAHTWAVAYVDRQNDWTMNELVGFRRNTFGENFDDVAVSEERTMLAGSLTPVSYARYSGTDRFVGDGVIWWVAAVVTENTSIEVIVGTTVGTGDENSIEELVTSLRLIGTDPTE